MPPTVPAWVSIAATLLEGGIISTVREARVEEVLADIDENHIPDEHQVGLDMVQDEAVSNGGVQKEDDDTDEGNGVE